ncbi:hypothetical protein ACRALDRAFT_1066369 [Sodiomyces alcalophilus JCM 7366]|uniref:uncharacterized protein n=1 Tax=Sodiomyces alcalophilus JCM 7366 TaxID=591952 RepID=UPI0039B40431
MGSDKSVPDHLKSGPQFYFHFEFGFSYSPKHHGKKRGLTYKSRNWDQLSNGRRRAPLPSAHQLANCERQQDDQLRPSPPEIESQHSLPPPLSHPQPQSQPQLHFQRQTYHPQMPTSPVRAPAQIQQSHQPHPGRPQTEAHWTPSSPIERGRSAPPPSHVTPWDAEPEPMGCSALPRQPPPDDEIFTGDPTMIHAPSPSDDESARGEREDPGRRKELEDLSTAMMTVDNGFEDQWWYQGQREVLWRANTGRNAVRERWSLDAAMPSVAATMGEYTPAPIQRQPTTGSLGWAVAQDADSVLASSFVDGEFVVSPLTELSSPQRPPVGMQQRLAARSDELFLP